MEELNGKTEYSGAVAPAIVTAPKKSYLAVKRAFDVAASLAALILLSPFLLIIAVLIQIDSPGPVIHKRWCVGKKGPYAMLKFRTMVADADDLEKYFQGDDLETYLQGVKIEDDPRITKIGKVLRPRSLDELPQLINVLKGDMSLIGPRPVIEREAEAYGTDREKLLSCRPGITGCWQVAGRGDIAYLSDEARSLQLYYVDHQSLGLDIEILIKTFKAVLSRRGAR